MKDIELPMPFGYMGKTQVFTAAQVQRIVEADRAQRVPDWSHPKVQALIGSDARKRVQIDLLWRILENPNDEFGPSDMEYWDAIHDRLKSALLASTPAQPAQQELEKALEPRMSRACLDAWDKSSFTAGSHDAVHPMFLEAFSAGFKAAAQHQEPPQPVERKPMTEWPSCKCPTAGPDYCPEHSP